jgi:acyl-CoA thioester hydrolase
VIHRIDIQVRFADTDAMGHLNNASYALYAETARLEFMRSVGAPVTSLILARLAIDFRSQATYGSPTHVESWIDRIGRSSIGIAHKVMSAGQVAAEMNSVIVHFDYATARAIEIPDDLRSRLEPYFLPSPAVKE